MSHPEGFQWYSKYIADIASNGQYTGANATEPKRFLFHQSVAGGTVLVVGSSVSAVFLAALTLAATISIPLIYVRVARTCAVIWNALQRPMRTAPLQQLETAKPMLQARVHSLDDDADLPSPIGGLLVMNRHVEKKSLNHLPVLLSNSGQWLSDAFSAISLLTTQPGAHSRQVSLAYGVYFAFCLLALVTGPLAAALVSKTVRYGFGDVVDGPCIRQNNFTYGAINPNTSSTDHHARAMELLPFIGNFNYSWSQMGAKAYFGGGPVIDPISQVNYTRLNGCLLKDDVLCSTEFPHTHMVTAELTPSQMGMWSGDDWRFRMKGYCLRLNSSSISKFVSYRVQSRYEYHLSFAEGSNSIGPPQPVPDPPLGQREWNRFPRRKNTIWDSYFPGESLQGSEEDRGWDAKVWRQSLHALNAEAINVETVFPTFNNVSQAVGDELYLVPDSSSAYMWQPQNIAHILCWEQLFVVVNGAESTENTTWRFWKTREDFVQRHKLDPGVAPLIQMLSGEFIIKPLRFLRGNLLLTTISDTPGEWEVSPIYASPVPFGAEMHRWAHIGLQDMASKATRTASGYYARGIEQSQDRLDALRTPEILSLCRSIRKTAEGSLSVPLWIPVVMLLLLMGALCWWAVEFGLTWLAKSGRPGFWRPFLMLPITKPTSLNAAVAEHVEPGARESVNWSASGWPLVMMHGRLGPVLERKEDDNNNKYVLRWGLLQRENPKAKIKII